MNKVITLRTKSAKFWPNKTPVVFMGNDLKRSIIPEVMSAFRPIAADAPAKAIVCTKIPGIKNDLYELSPTSIAPPKT